MGKTEANSLLGRPRRRWKYNIKPALSQYGAVKWIDLVEDRDQ
jgi:hypothetical protein